MPLAFYMDEHIPKAITLGLRLRGIDVLTAQEDGKEGNSDVELLDRGLRPPKNPVHLRR